MKYKKEDFVELLKDYYQTIKGIKDDYDALFDELAYMSQSEYFDDETEDKLFDFQFGALSSTIRLIDGKVKLPKIFDFYIDDETYDFISGTKEEILKQLLISETKRSQI